MTIPKAYLVWISKNPCPACENFRHEWDLLVAANKDKNIVLKTYTVSRTNTEPPAPLNRYNRWFPMILLVPGGVYHNCFFVEPSTMADDPREGKLGKCKAAVFNAISDGIGVDSISMNQNMKPFKFDTVQKWVRETLKLPMFREIVEITTSQEKPSKDDKEIKLYRDGKPSDGSVPKGVKDSYPPEADSITLSIGPARR
jgi:hypothetical protein